MLAAISLSLALVLHAPEASPVTTTDLTAKIDALLETPESTTIAALEQTIADLEARAQDVIADKALADELLRARVALAWAQQDPKEAAVAMDEAIRSAAGRPLPLTGLGSDLKALAKQRTTILEGGGTADIEVDCSVPCQVIINERRSVNPTDPLLLGTYRVWVVATEDGVEPMREDVVLDEAGQTKRLEFGKVEAPPPVIREEPPRKQAERQRLNRQASEKPDKRKQRPASAGKKQMLPLWVEIVGVIAGAGLVATGAGLLAMDGKCKDGSDPATCPILIENTSQGAALVGIGSGILVPFGALLGVDQARAGQNKRAAAMVSWTFRF